MTLAERPTGRGLLRSLGTAVSALENRDFRILWLGAGGHAFTLWMEVVARNWLVWELTGSVVAVGLVNFFRTIPVLFLAVPAGVVADRLDRRTILIVTQILILAAYLALVVLLAFGTLQLWQIYLVFFVRGVAVTFNQPPRQALIPTLVKAHQVSNAVALQQAVFNGTRIVAPLLTGFLFVAGGGTAVFLAIVGIEVLVILAWLLLRTPPLPVPEGPRPSAVRSSVEGLGYVARHRVVLLLLAFGLFSLLLLQPYTVVLPKIAAEGFGTGATGYATFLSIAGIGAFIGPLALAFLGDFRAKGALVAGSLVLSGVLLAAVGFAPWLPLAFLLIGGIGLFDAMQRAVTSALILVQTDRAFHGRVVSLYLLDRGFVPIGSLVAGYLAEGLGAAETLAVMGGTLVLATLLLVAAQPRFLAAR